MWIALGLIGALWLIGGVISPDKNGPPGTGVFSSQPAPTHQADAAPGH